MQCKHFVLNTKTSGIIIIALLFYKRDTLKVLQQQKKMKQHLHSVEALSALTLTLMATKYVWHVLVTTFRFQ